MNYIFNLSYSECLSITFVIVLCLYLLSLLRLNITLFVLGYLFFIVAFPLGHDTLNYSGLICDEYLPRYGLLWTMLFHIYKLLNVWEIVYFIAYGILIFSFYLLSQKVKNASLFFITLILAPAIGFDFLSIIRQALATAFIILSFYFVKRPARFWFFSIFAAFAHVTSVVFPLYYFLKDFKNNNGGLKRRIIVVLALFGILLFGYYIFNHPELIDPYYFIDLYITNKDSEASGKFVLIYWIIIAITPLILYFSIDYKIQMDYLKKIIYYFVVYIFFWQISPPAARLAWYFLPIVLFKGFELIEILPSIHQKFYYGLIVLMTLSSACYGLFITHDNFWIGTYE